MQQHGSTYFACGLLPTPLPHPTPPPNLGVGSKGQNSLFQNMVMLNVKLNATTWLQFFFIRSVLPQTLKLSDSEYLFSLVSYLLFFWFDIRTVYPQICYII